LSVGIGAPCADWWKLGRMAAEIGQVPLGSLFGKFIINSRNKMFLVRRDVSNQTLGNEKIARYRLQSCGRNLSRLIRLITNQAGNRDVFFLR
jgi:hypothetical protein